MELGLEIIYIHSPCLASVSAICHLVSYQRFGATNHLTREFVYFLLAAGRCQQFALHKSFRSPEGEDVLFGRKISHENV